MMRFCMLKISSSHITFSEHEKVIRYSRQYLQTIATDLSISSQLNLRCGTVIATPVHTNKT